MSSGQVSLVIFKPYIPVDPDIEVMRVAKYSASNVAYVSASTFCHNH